MHSTIGSIVHSVLLNNLEHCICTAMLSGEALYMHSHDDKYPARSGFEPGTSRLQASVDTNEPSGPVRYTCLRGHNISLSIYYNIQIYFQLKCCGIEDYTDFTDASKWKSNRTNEAG